MNYIKILLVEHLYAKTQRTSEFSKQDETNS